MKKQAEAAETKVATVSLVWDTTPDNTSVYNVGANQTNDF